MRVDNNPHRNVVFRLFIPNDIRDCGFEFPTHKMALIWLKARQSPFFRLMPQFNQCSIQHPHLDLNRLLLSSAILECQIAAFLCEFNAKDNSVFDQKLAN